MLKSNFYSLIWSVPTKNMYIEGYKSELMQALLAIINNAQEALADKKDKKIFISTNAEGKYYTITIKDNADGIKEEIREKIFDPQSSTKEEKNGLGLGLYMTKLIVEKHHKGKIEVYNDNGAVFKIYLRKNL